MAKAGTVPEVQTHGGSRVECYSSRHLGVHTIRTEIITNSFLPRIDFAISLTAVVVL